MLFLIVLFQMKKLNPERLNKLPKVTKWVSGRAAMQTQPQENRNFYIITSNVGKYLCNLSYYFRLEIAKFRHLRMKPFTWYHRDLEWQMKIPIQCQIYSLCYLQYLRKHSATIEWGKALKNNFKFWSILTFHVGHLTK